MKAVRLLSLLYILALAGCRRTPPARTIVLVDISGSIYPEEIDREFADIQKLASGLKRGDRLTVIPIAGSARNDTPGHVLVLDAPRHREAFDTDMSAFHKHTEGQIAAMQAWAKAYPAKKTDIFGTLRVAEEQAGLDKAHTNLVLMSDLLEDDSEVRFASDPRLAAIQAADCYAAVITSTISPFHNWNSIRIERLRSRDAGTLSSTRMDAVDEFWKKSFR